MRPAVVKKIIKYICSSSQVADGVNMGMHRFLQTWGEGF